MQSHPDDNSDASSRQDAAGLRAWLSGHAPRRIPIAYKLAFVITLLITAGMGVLGFVVVTNQTEVMRSEANAFGRTVVAQLAETAKEPVLAEDDLALQVMVSNLAHGGKLLGAVVYAENGSVLNRLGVVPEDDILDVYNEARRIEDRYYALDWQHALDSETSEALISFITPIQFRELTVGHALVTFSRNQMVESERKAKQMIIAATIALILLTIVGAFVMSRRISQPIYELMNASREIGEGNLAYRLNDRRNDELGTLMSAFNNMAQSLLEKSQVENALSRYMSDNIASEIISNINHVQLGGKHVQATVLFADIVGFTRLSEDMSPRAVADLLNEYFGYITRISQLYRGTIDKFIGDCVFVRWDNDKAQDNVMRALRTAWKIAETTARLKLTFPELPRPLRIGAGINTGMASLGIGADNTALGDAVNTAFRLESATKELGCDIALSESSYRHLPEHHWVGADQVLTLKGKQEPVRLLCLDFSLLEHILRE